MKTPMSHSKMHYLMTIQDLGSAKTHSLVKALNITAPTVSQALKVLLKKSWLEQDTDKNFTIKKDRR